MSKPRWVRTLVAQVALCIALYFAFQLGQPQKFVYNKRSESRPIDLYFISVRGGFRPVFQQTHLLKQVAKVAKTYKARFVVNISELGEDDPLTQNATQQVPTLKVPWYTTRVSKVHEEGYFLKQVNIPYGKTLDIIGVNTGFLQDALRGPSNETGNNQLHWLTRTVEASRGNWRIVVGFHSFAVCGERSDEMEANQILETLQNTFTKFEVNAYISGQDCDNHAHQGSIGYNENPGLAEKRPSISFSNGRSVSKRCISDLLYLFIPNLQGFQYLPDLIICGVFLRDLVNGFLLHRVSSIELATYFVNSSGEVVHRSVVQQRGKEVM
ncbi:hypothetical protein UlMin_002666 [Ulmus minor]